MSKPGPISSPKGGTALSILKCRFGTGLTGEEKSLFFKLFTVFFFQGAEDLGIRGRVKE